MQYSSFVNFLVSATDRLRPMHDSQCPIRLYSPSPTQKFRQRITQRSNHGQIRISASEMAFPKKKSPAIALSNCERVFLISCWQSSIEVICLYLALLKSSIIALHSLLMRRRILARQKVSLGMRLLPEGNAYAKYQQTGSLSVRQWSPWMRMGTFPSDLGSFPRALRYELQKQSPFSPRDTFLKVAGSYFQMAVIRALCAKGQNLLQIMVTSLAFSMNE